ncbi:MAG: ArsR family transcriptional regulator [Candidatus Thorarchaeota archaeon]|nr:ArsR family transcriptional regulator [Candidatus Thorarchaeota archaeon]
MNDDKDALKHELAEIRELKEALREELDEIRREKEELRKIRAESVRKRRDSAPRPPPEGPRHGPSPRPPHERYPPRPSLPRLPRGREHHPHGRQPTIIDLESLAESLEDMMSGLGEQIRVAMSSIKPIDLRIRGPSMRREISKSRIKSRAKRLKKVESIPPDRIARILSPLGNVERLRILDYLKDGAKTFNDIESYIGKTGSSLTHHLSPLIEAGYVVKGAVRGTYYITVSGRLAYRLAQWLTSQVEHELSAILSEDEEEIVDGDAPVEDEDMPDEDLSEDDEFELSPESDEEDVW